MQGNENDYLHDQLHCTRKEKTSRGEPFWDDHPTNLLLHQDLKDVKEGKKNKQLPLELRILQKEYKDFSVKKVCSHVHQEKRNQREEPYWIPQRNKQGMRKHEKETNAVKNNFNNRYFEEELDEIGNLFEAFHLRN